MMTDYDTAYSAGVIPMNAQGASSQVIYHVQLPSGLVVTGPNAYPPEAANQAAPPPNPSRPAPAQSPPVECPTPA
jgi:hypothetical protein